MAVVYLAFIVYFLCDENLAWLSLGTEACSQLNRRSKKVAMFLNGFSGTQANPQM